MKNKIKDYIVITIGYIIIALAIKFFLAPNKIASGGITGVAIIVNNYTKVSIGMLTLVLNGILFIVAFSAIGGKFGARTVYASLGLSVVLIILDEFIPSDFALTNDLLLATLFGTFITAIGMGIIFNRNASTGGTDILAKILSKFIHLDIGKALLVVDFVVAVAGGFAFSAEIGMYGILSVILLGITVDMVIEGLNTCKTVVVISAKNYLINKYIIEELDRGCTIFEGKGAYSGNSVDVLYTVLDRKQFIKLREYIKGIDKKAFITVSEAHEVLGEGFKDIIEG